MNERKLKMQPPIWAAFKCVNSINYIQFSIYPYLWLMHVLDKSQRASGNKLRAAIDVARKQYQPKQLK